MTGETYIRSAAGNLRAAAQALQQDIADARNQYAQIENQVRDEIREMHKQVNNNNTMMALPNVSDLQRADRMRDNGQLQSRITDREHELSSMKQQTDQRIRDIQRQMDSLNQQAANLEKLFV